MRKAGFLGSYNPLGPCVFDQYVDSHLVVVSFSVWMILMQYWIRKKLICRAESYIFKICLDESGINVEYWFELYSQGKVHGQSETLVTPKALVVLQPVWQSPTAWDIPQHSSAQCTVSFAVSTCTDLSVRATHKQASLANKKVGILKWSPAGTSTPSFWRRLFLITSLPANYFF